jgi:hypothetical protein
MCGGGRGKEAAMTDLRQAAQQALEALTSRAGDSWTRRFARDRAIEALETALAQAEPAAWREHVENRIRTWRNSLMNRSGDRLSIDDYMGADDIDDLVDFVCDEYAAPPQKAEPVQFDPAEAMRLADEYAEAAYQFHHRVDEARAALATYLGIKGGSND